ncbi:MAG: hypothetical protein ACRDZO_01630 [Egibacteraceae bacterium]
MEREFQSLKLRHRWNNAAEALDESVDNLRRRVETLLYKDLLDALEQHSPRSSANEAEAGLARLADRLRDLGSAAAVRVRHDFRYQAILTYHAKHDYYSVTAHYSARRDPTIFSADHFTAFCRTDAQMARQFADGTNASVELVDMPSDRWEASKKYLCSIISIDGVDRDGSVVVEEADLVRIEFQPVSVPNARPSVLMKNTYVISGSTRRFPIKISGFAFGRTEFMIALRDRRVGKVEAFLALAGVSPAGEILSADETRLVERFLPVAEDDNHALVICVPENSVLWPGSGVEFTWERVR